jgi:hypothetical protein
VTGSTLHAPYANENRCQTCLSDAVGWRRAGGEQSIRAADGLGRCTTQGRPERAGTGIEECREKRVGTTMTRLREHAICAIVCPTRSLQACTASLCLSLEAPGHSRGHAMRPAHIAAASSSNIRSGPRRSPQTPRPLASRLHREASRRSHKQRSHVCSRQKASRTARPTGPATRGSLRTFVEDISAPPGQSLRVCRCAVCIAARRA